MPSTATPTEDVIASCSFCGKPDTTAQRLVAGPGVYICNECIELSATIVEDAAYRKATDRTRKLFNSAVFERIDVKDGRLCHEEYRPPSDGVFTVSEFEYGTQVETVVEKTISYSNFRELRKRISALGPSRREPAIRPGSP